MTLAVMALYADGTTTLRNIASWRVKETDRIAAMATELRKLGATVEEGATSSGHPTCQPRLALLRGEALAPRQHPHLRRPPRGHVLFAGGLQPGRPAGAHRRPQMRGQDLPGLLRGLFSVARPAAAMPVICHRRPHRLGQGHAGRAVAKRLGYHFLDSGALYRITALAALRAGWRPTPSP
jgi:3-phosphoshikimate 1-carboxyvinyltransferase